MPPQIPELPTCAGKALETGSPYPHKISHHYYRPAHQTSVYPGQLFQLEPVDNSTVHKTTLRHIK